jgi:heme exporter protein C
MMEQSVVVQTLKRGWALTFAGLLGLALVYVWAALFTPVESTQGPAQKIFYIHVPSAWASLIAFAVTGILSLIYLLRREPKHDTIADASAEVGLVFGVVMLTTGPIWGKTVWGAWWGWDAKLTSTLFLFLLFIGYKVLRGALVDPEMRARFSAVIGIMALVLVPFIYFSVLLFRTLHPDPPVLRAGAPSLPGSMLFTLLLSVLVFSVLYVGFLMLRYALSMLREIREEEAANGIS